MTEYKNNKLEVTDEIVQVAQNAYDFTEVHPLMNRTVRIRAALEAVFAMLPEAVSANNTQSIYPLWIEWKGGICPVPENTTIEVMCRSIYAYPYLEKEEGRAGQFNWSRKGAAPENGEITAYRIIDKPEPEKESYINTMGQALIDRHNDQVKRMREKEKIPTLLEWLRNQSLGQSSPAYQYTEREKVILSVVSKYLRYLDKYMKEKD